MAKANAEQRGLGQANEQRFDRAKITEFTVLAQIEGAATDHDSGRWRSQPSGGVEVGAMTRHQGAAVGGEQFGQVRGARRQPAFGMFVDPHADQQHDPHRSLNHAWARPAQARGAPRRA